MSEILVSVVICTKNRAKYLSVCLEEVIKQASEFSDVEIVVIDNASTDDTKAVVDKLFTNATPSCRYVYEGRAGISNTRNSGRAAARGGIIAYTDDDAIPRPGWMDKVRGHFLDSGSDYLAGKVELKLDAPLPGWFSEGLLWVIGKSPFGDKVKVLESESPISANCAIRAAVFDAVGGYDPRISYYGEEVNFFYRIKEKGFITLFRTDIVVDHHVPPERLTKAALRGKAYLMGRGAAQVAVLPSVSLYGWLKLFAENLYRLCCVGCAWLTRPRFDREFTFRQYLGYMIQLLTKRQAG